MTLQMKRVNAQGLLIVRENKKIYIQHKQELPAI